MRSLSAMGTGGRFGPEVVSGSRGGWEPLLDNKLPTGRALNRAGGGDFGHL